MTGSQHIAPRPNVSVRTVRAVDRALARVYGHKQREPGRADLIAVLVGTILSQNTTAANSQAAFEALKRAFASWEEVATAPVHRIAQAIRSGGLANQKAVRIKQLLARIQARQHELSLEFLRHLPDDEVFSYLLSFEGVGPKTAACVLLFGLGRDVFPVDTHIFRVTSRLGWLPEGATVRQAHDILGRLIPADLHYQMHVNLIAHGRARCRPQRPRCKTCPLGRFCNYYQAGAGPDDS